MIADGWPELNGIAELVAAGATVALAGVTTWMAAKTRVLAKKAGAEIEVATRQAAATEALALEAKEDRRLSWRPQLAMESLIYDSQGFGSWNFKVANLGQAPALSVVCMARRADNNGHLCLAPVGGLRAGEEKQAQAQDRSAQGGACLAPFEVDDVRPPAAVVAVMLCQDVLGRRFRFPITDLGYSGGRTDLALPAEISDSEPRPTLAIEPLVWG